MDAGMQWVQEQFIDAPLGDRRRSRRLAKVACDYARGGADASATLTSVIRHRHQVKAAYRLWDCPHVNHDQVIAEHCRRVQERARAPGTYLVIEDTTSAGFPGLVQARGLGPIGESYTRGLWLHNALMVHWPETDPGPGVGRTPQVLGLLGQTLWVRPPPRPGRGKGRGRGKESNHARQKRTGRESQRWGAMTLAAAAGKPPEAQWVFLADRESDIYEVLQKMQTAATMSYVIRAAYSRAVAEKELGGLMAAIAAAPLHGHCQVDLQREDRAATLAVRGTRAELRGPPRPGGRLPNLWVNVVQVREINAPHGAKPVCWTLLTDLAVASLEQCLVVVALYCHRWLVEELHKALKTGLKLESSQLGDGRKLGALAGVLSVIATQLVQAKLLARSQPQAAVTVEPANVAPVVGGHSPALGLGAFTPVMVAMLSKLYPPQGQPTWSWLWRSLAMLGGYMGRPSDGPPGWLTIWRGRQRLRAMADGYELLSG